MEEIEAGRLKEIAEAMQLSVTIERTDDGASGGLGGVIPHSFEELEGDFSHHCTNMGITTCTKASSPSGRTTPGLDGDDVPSTARSVSITCSTSIR